MSGSGVVKGLLGIFVDVETDSVVDVDSAVVVVDEDEELSC